MKKIQCEVCGSIDIRKAADGIFACQHCGVQYRTEDMGKLLVEIKDILENIEDSVSKGSNKYEPKTEKSQQENCYILDAKIAPQENVRHFLSYLDKADDIVCDIYKEISIERTKEFYLPFFYIKGQYAVDWSAIACHTYYENEVTYENRYNTKKHEFVKEPVTRQVERIQRTNRNGKQKCACSSFVLASTVLKEEFAALNDKEKEQLFAEFQSQQYSKILNDYHLKPFDQANLQEKNGHVYYADWEILNEMDSDIANDERNTLRSRAKRIARDEAQKGLNGGTFENYSDSQSILSETLSFVYVPVQIITYQYKGQKFIAVSDLVSTTRTIPAIYPCDEQLKDIQEKMEQKEIRAAKKSPLTTIALILLALGCLAVFYLAIVDFTSDAMFLTIAGIGISLILLVVGLIMDAANRNRTQKASSKLFLDVLSPRKIALTNCRQAALAAFSDDMSLTSADLAKLQCPEVRQYNRALFESFPLNWFEKDMEADQMLMQIMALEKKLCSLERKKVVSIVLMTVLGILFVPLVVGSIIYGNTKNKILQTKQQLQILKDQWLEKN